MLSKKNAEEKGSRRRGVEGLGGDLSLPFESTKYERIPSVRASEKRRRKGGVFSFFSSSRGRRKSEFRENKFRKNSYFFLSFPFSTACTSPRTSPPRRRQRACLRRAGRGTAEGEQERPKLREQQQQQRREQRERQPEHRRQRVFAAAAAAAAAAALPRRQQRRQQQRQQ